MTHSPMVPSNTVRRSRRLHSGLLVLAVVAVVVIAVRILAGGGADARGAAPVAGASLRESAAQAPMLERAGLEQATRGSERPGAVERVAGVQRAASEAAALTLRALDRKTGKAVPGLRLALSIDGVERELRCGLDGRCTVGLPEEGTAWALSKRPASAFFREVAWSFDGPESAPRGAAVDAAVSRGRAGALRTGGRVRGAMGDLVLDPQRIDALRASDPVPELELWIDAPLFVLAEPVGLPELEGGKVPSARFGQRTVADRVELEPGLWRLAAERKESGLEAGGGAIQVELRDWDGRWRAAAPAAGDERGIVSERLELPVEGRSALALAVLDDRGERPEHDIEVRLERGDEAHTDVFQGLARLRFKGLEPGLWDLSLAWQGFELQRTSVDLPAFEVLELDLPLEVGQLTGDRCIAGTLIPDPPLAPDAEPPAVRLSVDESRVVGMRRTHDSLAACEVTWAHDVGTWIGRFELCGLPRVGVTAHSSVQVDLQALRALFPEHRPCSAEFLKALPVSASLPLQFGFSAKDDEPVLRVDLRQPRVIAILRALPFREDAWARLEDAAGERRSTLLYSTRTGRGRVGGGSYSPETGYVPAEPYQVDDDRLWIFAVDPRGATRVVIEVEGLPCVYELDEYGVDGGPGPFFVELP